MRWISTALLAVAVAVAVVVVFVVACSKKAGPSGIVPRSGNAPGAVTFRFVNSTAADVQFEGGTGHPFAITDKDERGMPELHFCQTSCDEDCMCHTCGSPMPITTTIPAGAVHEARWDGDFFEETGKTCPRGGCGCGERRFAEDGTYTVTLEATQAGKTCTAKKSFALKAGAQAIDVPFTCAP
jgi:hypothetical protein